MRSIYFGNVTWGVPDGTPGTATVSGDVMDIAIDNCGDSFLQSINNWQKFSGDFFLQFTFSNLIAYDLWRANIGIYVWNIELSIGWSFLLTYDPSSGYRRKIRGNGGEILLDEPGAIGDVFRIVKTENTVEFGIVSGSAFVPKCSVINTSSLSITLALDSASGTPPFIARIENPIINISTGVNPMPTLPYDPLMTPVQTFIPGRDEKICLVTESTFGVAGLPTDIAATWSRVHTAALDPGQNMVERADIYASRTQPGKLYGKRNPKGDISCCVAPSGIAGVKPDISPLLETAYLARPVVGGEVITNPTNAGFVCATLPSFSVGDLIAVPVNGIPVVVTVYSITPGSGGYIVTWRQRLPEPPDSGATIGASIQYLLQETPSGSCTVYRPYRDYAEMVCGAIASKFKVQFNQNKESDITVSAVAKDFTRATTMTLQATIDGTTQTIPVDQLLINWNESGTMMLKIENEIVTVGGYDGSTTPPTLTVLRGQHGTSNVAHTVGSTPILLTPYFPTPVYHGQAIIDQGYAWLDDVLAVLTSASVESDEGYALENTQVGSRTAATPYAPKKRKVKADAELFFLRNDPYVVQKIDAWTNAAPARYNLTLQIGKTLGNILAVDVIGIQTAPVKIDSQQNDELKVKLSGECVADDADYAAGNVEKELHFAVM